jgi:hypothetical protein
MARRGSELEFPQAFSKGMMGCGTAVLGLIFSEISYLYQLVFGNL